MLNLPPAIAKEIGQGKAIYRVSINCEKHGHQNALSYRGKEAKCPMCLNEHLAKSRYPDDDDPQEIMRKRLIQQRDQQRKVERKLNAAAIPEKFREKKLNNYKAENDAQKHVKEQLTKYCFSLKENLASGKNIILSGNSGTGKNHLSCAVANYALTQGFSAFFTTQEKLLTKIKATFSNSEKSQDKLIDELIKLDLLIIDELYRKTRHGAEETEWRHAQINAVIDGRYSENKSTIICTNLAVPELLTQLSEILFSRLAENALILTMNWENYRLKQMGLQL